MIRNYDPNQGLNALIGGFGRGQAIRGAATNRQVGNALASGDYGGAQTAAFRGGQVQNGLQIGRYRQALEEQARTLDGQARSQQGALWRDIGQVGNALRRIPVEQRGQAFMSVADRFRQRGASPDQLNTFAQALSDPTRSDGVLAALSAAAVDADEVFKASAPVTLGQGDVRAGYQGGRFAALGENVDEVGQSNAQTGRMNAQTSRGRLELDRQEAARRPQSDFNSNEQLAAGFAARMTTASRVIDELAAQGFNPTSVGAGWSPGILAGENTRRFRQAAEDWINANLRRESGAAISDQERESAMRTFFPRVGDSAAVVQQKANARSLQERNLVESSNGAFAQMYPELAGAQPRPQTGQQGASPANDLAARASRYLGSGEG